MTKPKTFLNPKKNKIYNFTFVHFLNKRCSIILLCLLALSQPTLAGAQLKAFACAQGFGATSKGGRGGDVYHVTKLSDDGSAGTLRYGIEKAKGPRTIVFDVGGIIHLKKNLIVKKSNLTFAGQTAPGGGITLTGYRFAINGSSNVIVRYMRFRLGDYNFRQGRIGDPIPKVILGNGNKDVWVQGADPFLVNKSNNVIADHISSSWSGDETLDVFKSKNVTVQNSIVSEALINSFNLSKNRSGGSLGMVLNTSASNAELEKGRGGITIYQNLLAHNNWRNPVVSNGDDGYNGTDFVNNVVYNWGEYSGHSGKSKIKLNYVNNYLIAGPSTTSRNLNTAMIEHDSYEGQFYIYQAGNFMDTDKDRAHDGKPVGREAFKGFENNERLTKPLPWPKIDQVISAEGAYQNILKYAGASLARDSIDRRVINDVRNRTGKIINSQKDVGGLSPLARGRAPTDSDRDGMPDNWEKANGLDPKNALDRNRTNLSNEGYTNLEVYLDSIVASAGHCPVGNNKVKAATTPIDKGRNNSSKVKNNLSKFGSASFSIWDNADTPITISENDSGAVELGVKFKTDVDGVIRGIRFYKGKGNTGKHIGNLWTSKGRLLASATFTNETASGWQQVIFDEPVAIYKDTIYVASYHAPKGHYASDEQVFTDAGIDQGPLHLLKTRVNSRNGIYTYGRKSSFPKSTYLSTNYWVDVVFNKTEKETIKEEIITDENSNWEFTNVVSRGPACCSIWDDFDAPINASEKDSGAVELGVKFMSDEDGAIEGIRFYKGKGNTGRHIGNLWTNKGHLLASAVFTGETATGWQQVYFAKPVAIKKGTVYVASYHAPKGHYANDKNAFARSGIDNGSLHLLKTGVSGKNGVYTYGKKSSFPKSTYFSSNYWVDVIFNNQLVATNDN
jgi:Domain of unknown function (DUF4082)